MDLYNSFSVPDNECGQATLAYQIGKLATKCSPRPSSITRAPQCCTSVVVRFTEEDDAEEMTGWSTFLVAWLWGHFGEVSLAGNIDFSPPVEGQYDITITAPDYAFEGCDRGDVTVVGDENGVFEVSENLTMIIKASITMD